MKSAIIGLTGEFLIITAIAMTLLIPRAFPLFLAQILIGAFLVYKKWGNEHEQ